MYKKRKVAIPTMKTLAKKQVKRTAMKKQKVRMYSMRDFLFTIKQLASVRIGAAAGARTYHYIWLMTNILHIK